MFHHRLSSISTAEILEDDVWMIWPDFTGLNSFIRKYPFLNLLLLLLLVYWVFKRFNNLNISILIKNYNILNSIFILIKIYNILKSIFILIKNYNILNSILIFIKNYNILNSILILIKNYNILNKNNTIFIKNNILVNNNSFLMVFGAFVVFLGFLNIFFQDHFVRRNLSHCLQSFDFWNFSRRLLREFR